MYLSLIKSLLLIIKGLEMYMCHHLLECMLIGGLDCPWPHPPQINALLLPFLPFSVARGKQMRRTLDNPEK